MIPQNSERHLEWGLERDCYDETSQQREGFGDGIDDDLAMLNNDLNRVEETQSDTTVSTTALFR